MPFASRHRGQSLIAAATCASLIFVLPAAAADDSKRDPAAAQKYEAQADKLLSANDLKGANIELRNAVKLDPDNPALRIRLADVELRLNDFDGANLDITAAGLHGGDESKVIPLLARYYMQQSKYDDLLRNIQPSPTGTPAARIAIQVARADAQIQLKQLDDAKESLEKAEEIDPQDAAPKSILAQIALSQSQFDAAIKDIDEVIRLAPTADAYTLKGRILEAKNDPDGALAQFELAIKADPSNVEGYIGRADLLIARGEEDKATADIDKVLAERPRLVAGNYYKALLLGRKKDYAAADTILTKYSTSFRDFPQGYYLQASIKNALRQYQQARTAIDAYLRAVPDSDGGQKLLATIMMETGEAANAVEVLEKVVAHDANDFEALALLGRAYAQVKNPQRAAEIFEQAGNLKPENTAVSNAAARNLLASGRSADAILELEKTLRAAPDDEAAAETLIVAYLRGREYGKARAAADSLLAKKPKDPVAGSLGALVEQAQFHLPEAEAAYKAVLQQSPDFAQAKIELAFIYTAEGRPDQAREIYKSVLAKNPANLLVVQRLSALPSPNPLDQNVELWQAAHKAKPDNLQIARALVQALIAKKDIDAGLATIQDMLLRQPNEPLLYTLRAQLELKKGTAKAAVTSLQRAAGLKPDDAVAKRDLAVAQDAALDLPAAIATIREARKLDPGSIPLAAEEIRLRGKRNPEDGLAVARQTAADLPDRPGAQVLEGDYLNRLKRPADAKAAYLRAFKAHPTLLLVDRLAEAAIRAGAPDEAAKYLTDWAAAHPDDLSAKLLLAGFDLGQKKYADAKPLYEAVLKGEPDNPKALNDLAWLYQHDGDARALGLAKRAYAEMPQNPAVADTLGWIMVQGGDVPNGLKFLQQARSGLPADPGVQYHVAAALDRAGNKPQALDAVRKAIAAGKEFDEKKDAEALLASLSKT